MYIYIYIYIYINIYINNFIYTFNTNNLNAIIQNHILIDVFNISIYTFMSLYF